MEHMGTIFNMARNVNKEHKENLTVNERIGLYVTNRVGTMPMAYAFCALSIISLPSVIISGDSLIIVVWIAQTFLQLVLLPIIMVGQNVQSKHAELLAEASYEADVKSEKDIQEIKRLLKKYAK